MTQTPELGGSRRPEGWTLVAHLAMPAIIVVYGTAFLVSIDGLPLFAAVFPRIAVIMLLVCAAVIAVEEVRQFRRRQPVTERGTEPELTSPDDGGRDGGFGPGMQTFLVAALTVGLSIGIPNLGMLTSIAVFLAFGFRVMGMRWWPQLPFLVIAVVLSIWVIFEQLLGLQVPSGTWLP